MSDHLHRVRVAVDIEVWGETRLGNARDVAVVEVTKLLEPYYPSNVRVLDAGCGDEGLSDSPGRFLIPERDGGEAIPSTPLASSDRSRMQTPLVPVPSVSPDKEEVSE